MWTSIQTLSAVTCLGAALGATVNPAAPPAPVPFPEGYRSWQHVKSILVGPENKNFANRGGLHHYYANARAVEGYQGGSFPDGSVIVVEALWTKAGEGPATGIVQEGSRRFLEIMVKDAQRFAETGGWAYERFEGDEKNGGLDATRRAACHECHAKRRDRDHVFTTIRP